MTTYGDVNSYIQSFGKITTFLGTRENKLNFGIQMNFYGKVKNCVILWENGCEIGESGKRSETSVKRALSTSWLDGPEEMTVCAGN